MKRYNQSAAVIGMGGISSVHVKSLQTLGVPITAICDNKPDRAKVAHDELGCAYFTDYNEMLKAGGFDVLHICLPHYLHATVAVAALLAGYHVVCEKPMATTVEDAHKMLAAVKTSGKELEIVFQNRYNATSQAVKAVLDAGALGKVTGGWLQVTWHRTESYYSQSDWRGHWATEGGGVLINQSIHTFDLMNFFLGAPESVSGSVANRAHPSIEVEDMAEGVIMYGDVPISFFVNNYHPYDAPVRLEVVCENGRATIDGDMATVTYADGRVEKYSNDDNVPDLQGKAYWGYSHVKQFEAFYDVLNGKAASRVCGLEGMRTQQLINGIYEAAKTVDVIFGKSDHLS